MTEQIKVMVTELQLEEIFTDCVREVHEYTGSHVICLPVVDGKVLSNTRMVIELIVTRLSTGNPGDMNVMADIRCFVRNRSELASVIDDDSKCDRLLNEIETTTIRIPVTFSRGVAIGKNINMGGRDYVW